MAVISVFSATQLSKPNSKEVSVFSLGFDSHALEGIQFGQRPKLSKQLLAGRSSELIMWMLCLSETAQYIRPSKYNLYILNWSICFTKWLLLVVL